MVSCPRCGAHVDTSALACPYCQTQTAHGRYQAERAAAYREQADAAERARRAEEREARQRALSKKGQHSLFWSLGGALTCCLPAGLVGFVLALNVKSAAKRENFVAPITSTVALVLGVASLATFGAGVALYIHDSRATDARIAELRAKVDSAPASEQLEQPLACALSELELLQEGFGGTIGLNIEGFECAGRVEQRGDRARLESVRFKTGSNERRTVAACLVRGARWRLEELREDGSCEPRVPAPSVSSPAR